MQNDLINNTSDGSWRGKVFLWEEQALFLGGAGKTILHESPAIKILISLDGEFRLRSSEDDSWHEYRSAMVAAGQPHAIDGQGKKLALIILVPEARAAQPLIPIMLRKGITRLPAAVVQNFMSILQGFETLNTANVESETLVAELLTKLRNGQELLSASIDERVSQSVELIRADLENIRSIKEIAANVKLSESRFSHLFSENVRVPVRRYLLWMRLREAIHLLARGGSLTEIAHEAGFSDSAHLTRTFRQMLGITPSSLLKESSLTSFLEDRAEN